MSARARIIFAACAVLTLVAVPAVAEDDVTEMFETASTAEFAAEGVVLSTWGSESAATTYDVTRTDGMSMAHAGTDAFMSGGGMAASLTGTDWYALEVSEWSAWSMSERYSLGEPEPTVRLGRPATSIEVLQDDRVRVHLVLDDATSVPLLTEVFDGAGAVFRVATVTDFSDEPSMAGDDMPKDFAERMMIEPAAAPASLPTDAYGYVRTDVYSAGAAATQTYYSDGMFSYSVFVAGGSMPEAFDDSSLVAIGDDGPYRRIVTPSQVWIGWTVGGDSYVLVGDLPPDHLVEVMAEMPAPRSQGVIMRWLGRVFG